MPAVHSKQYSVWDLICLRTLDNDMIVDKTNCRKSDMINKSMETFRALAADCDDYWEFVRKIKGLRCGPARIETTTFMTEQRKRIKPL